MTRKKFWTRKRDKILRERYADCDIAELAAEIGVTYSALRSRAKILGLRRDTGNRKPWTEEEISYLREHYADTPSDECAEKTGHPIGSVYRQAKKLGLTKNPEFMKALFREKSNHPNIVAHRFKKGLIPANKGKRIEEFMSRDAIARCSRTRFKKGHTPCNTKPVGYERVSNDGYVFVKVSMGSKMVLKHRWVWEQAHGAIPEGYVVAFRDGNRQNCDLGNLYLMSREDNARRRAAEETPEERRIRIERCQVARNKSIRRDKVRIHWGFEPKGRLVKRW